MKAADVNFCQFGTESRAYEILAINFDELYFYTGATKFKCAGFCIYKTRKQLKQT